MTDTPTPAADPTTAEIPAGMKPWAGGESAPDDWDGGPVLSRRGHVVYGMAGQPPSRWMHLCSVEDVIAYIPTPAAERESGRR